MEVKMRSNKTRLKRHAHKLALPPLPRFQETLNTPPKRRNFVGMGGFPAERTEKCQAPIKLAQPFPAPESQAETLQTLLGFSDQNKVQTLLF